MATGILRFNLNEEKEEFEMAQKGWIYRLALSAVDAKLRSVVKYEQSLIGNEKANDSEYKMAEEIRNLIRQELDGAEI
jgi:hypothetical protein